jgi:hypothetical protein
VTAACLAAAALLLAMAALGVAVGLTLRLERLEARVTRIEGGAP